MSRPDDCPTCQQAPGHPALGGYCSVHCRDAGELEEEIQELEHEVALLMDERDALLRLERAVADVLDLNVWVDPIIRHAYNRLQEMRRGEKR